MNALESMRDERDAARDTLTKMEEMMDVTGKRLASVLAVSPTDTDDAAEARPNRTYVALRLSVPASSQLDATCFGPSDRPSYP